MNPITYDGNDLPNVITKVVMPPHVQKDVCSQEENGQQKYVAFVEERINKNKVSIWAIMKKVQLKMWKSARKAVKELQKSQVLTQKEALKHLFASCMSLVPLW